jgi:4-amino-4-deoxy-L-arabinose transferase-like glycosyltransferase
MTPSRTIERAPSPIADVATWQEFQPVDIPPDVEPTPGDESVEPTPRWARLGLVILLLSTAGAYLYNLAASGYGNSFYAAAVEAGSKSWKAMLFGSIDSSNFITVDKPPGSLWIMDLSARVFGFSTWSVMVPGVLEGVAAVALLYGTVRRVSNPAVGLVAGAVLAATPVAALMFRFDNPDALLVLLLTAAAYCVTRAIEKAGTGWIIAVGALLGFAFLTKMMQAFTVIPAFALAYFIAAPTTWRRRLGQLVGSLAALVVACGWWLAIVSLTPVADRPFIDGSPDNSIWNLIFVYNGFGRLSGSGNGGGGSNFSGTAGIFRLFNDAMGGQASWLLPAAILGLIAVLVGRRKAPRTDRLRAAAIIWGGWLLVTGAVFSYGKGVIHTYYTVALAPAIAALVALGGYVLWEQRDQLWARLCAAVAALATAAWAWTLLDRTPSWYPAVRVAVVVSGLATAVVVLALPLLRRKGHWLGVGLAVLVVVTFLGGPLAYAADTISTGHTGSIPSAGPASIGTMAGGGMGQGSGGAPGRSSGGRGAIPGSAPKGSFPSSTAGGSGRKHGSDLSGPGVGGSGGVGGGGSGGVTTSAALAKALESDASSYKWVAAVEGSQTAASLELATSGEPVMAIGGFNGEGGNLSLSAFERYVKDGLIHYYIGGSSGGGPQGSSSGSSITTWVESHFKSVTIGGQTVYDLSERSSGSS